MPFIQTGIPSIFYEPDTKPPMWLKLASSLYFLGVAIHQKLYDLGLLPVHHLPVPVISVGNLTAGGTGKTPITLSLAQWLESRGLRVAVLSRGYGAPIKTPCHIADNPQYGDEPFAIQQGLSDGVVIVGPDRLLTGQHAIKIYQPQLILLDDGFQHRRLFRELDIVLVDGQLGLGNKRLLPAGPLREPVRALHRADWVFLTKKINPEVKQLVHQQFDPALTLEVPFQVSGLLNPDTQGLEPLSSIRGCQVILLSGIAQPQTLEQMVLIDLKALVVKHHIFADHQNYTTKDLHPVEDALMANPDLTLLTTSKDWVKIQPILSKFVAHRVRVVTVEPHIDWASILLPTLTQWGLA